MPRAIRSPWHRWLRATRWPWEVRDNDVYLVSYPRSGNTWLGMMAAMLREPAAEFSPSLVRRYYCDPYARAADMPDMPPPRIIKSHSPSDPGFPRVIYLLRDGRDSLVSYYDFVVRSGSQLSFEEFVLAEIAGRGSFGSWARHVGSWVMRSDRRPGLILRYEDTWSEPRRSLHSVAGYLGIEASDATLEHCVLAAADHFQRTLVGRGNRRDKRHRWIGLGRGPGVWRERFSRELEDAFWSSSGVVMERMGYSRR